MFKKILIPSNLQADALISIAKGVEMARKSGGEIILLNVRHEFMNKEEMEMLRVSVSKFLKEERDIATSAKMALQDQLEQVGGSDVEHKILLREGDPHDEILATAQELGCELIIVTTTGRTRLGERIHGSDAEQLVRDTQIPVLVLPVHKPN